MSLDPVRGGTEGVTENAFVEFGMTDVDHDSEPPGGDFTFSFNEEDGAVGRGSGPVRVGDSLQPPGEIFDGFGDFLGTESSASKTKTPLPQRDKRSLAGADFVEESGLKATEDEASAVSNADAIFEVKSTSPSALAGGMKSTSGSELIRKASPFEHAWGAGFRDTNAHGQVDSTLRTSLAKDLASLDEADAPQSVVQPALLEESRKDQNLESSGITPSSTPLPRRSFHEGRLKPLADLERPSKVLVDNKSCKLKFKAPLNVASLSKVPASVSRSKERVKQTQASPSGPRSTCSSSTRSSSFKAIPSAMTPQPHKTLLGRRMAGDSSGLRAPGPVASSIVSTATSHSLVNDSDRLQDLADLVETIEKDDIESPRRIAEDNKLTALEERARKWLDDNRQTLHDLADIESEVEEAETDLFDLIEAALRLKVEIVLLHDQALDEKVEQVCNALKTKLDAPRLEA